MLTVGTTVYTIVTNFNSTPRIYKDKIIGINNDGYETYYMYDAILNQDCFLTYEEAYNTIENMI